MPSENSESERLIESIYNSYRKFGTTDTCLSSFINNPAEEKQRNNF